MPGKMQFTRRGLLLALVLLAIAGLAQAATLTVNSLADNTTGGDGLVTLREAIIAADNNTATDLGQTGTANDTLDLAGLSGVITLTGVMPTINGNISLAGPGSEVLAIDGATSHSFLTLNASANVQITGLTIRNCFRSDNGGAIRNAGSLTVNKSILENNRTRRVNQFDTMGSAIYGSGAASNITMNESIIRGNIAECSTSGFIYFVGSAVGSTGSIAATDCIFEDNSTLMSGAATGGGGMGSNLGGYNPTASISLDNCVIQGSRFEQPETNNFSEWGTIYVGFGMDLSATATTWRDNIGYPAACIYMITDITATCTVTLSNCTMSENGDHNSGALLYILQPSAVDLTLEHCTFVKNQSLGSLPQAIYSQGLYPTPKINLINTVLANSDKDLNRPELSNSLSFASNGFNFISNLGGATTSQPVATYANTAFTLVSQLVDPLGDNGGPVPTCALPTGSPLLDAANPSGFAATDQRGVSRPREGNGVSPSRPDIGAYERFDGDLQVTKSVNRTEAAVGNQLTYAIRVNNTHPTNAASNIIVRDTLPPNLRFSSFASSSFTTAEHADGEITLRRTTLNAGSSCSIRVICDVDPYLMLNSASATQLGYETNPANNTDDAATSLITPVAPRLLSLALDDATPTSVSQLAYTLVFDQDVSGVNTSDFQFDSGLAGTINQVSALSGNSVYQILVDVPAGDGELRLKLVDNDSILAASGEALNGGGTGGEYPAPVALIDQTAPVSAPVAAAGTLGPPESTVFHLLYQTTDTLAGVRGVDVHWRKGSSDPFELLPGGPFDQGFVAFDTAQHGGNGTYEFYIVATDRAGNVEAKPEAPEISVTFGGVEPQTGVLRWELY